MEDEKNYDDELLRVFLLAENNPSEQNQRDLVRMNNRRFTRETYGGCGNCYINMQRRLRDYLRSVGKYPN